MNMNCHPERKVWEPSVWIAGVPPLVTDIENCLGRLLEFPQRTQCLGSFFNRLLLGHPRIPLIYGFVPLGDIFAANGS